VEGDKKKNLQPQRYRQVANSSIIVELVGEA
jgi:hypothetical protein